MRIGTWYCDVCGRKMNVIEESKNRYLVICPGCGEEFCVDENDEIINDNDSYDDIPVGCRACGGPYPSCKISCNMFDEDD